MKRSVVSAAFAAASLIYAACGFGQMTFTADCQSTATPACPFSIVNPRSTGPDALNCALARNPAVTSRRIQINGVCNGPNAANTPVRHSTAELVSAPTSSTAQINGPITFAGASVATIDGLVVNGAVIFEATALGTVRNSTINETVVFDATSLGVVRDSAITPPTATDVGVICNNASTCDVRNVALTGAAANLTIGVQVSGMSRATVMDSTIQDFRIGALAQNGSSLRLARSGATDAAISGWSREAVRIVDGSFLTIDGAFDATNRYVINEPVANGALLNAITLFNSSARLRLVNLQYGAGFSGVQLLNGSSAHIESVLMLSSAAAPARSVWLGDLSHVYFANFLGSQVGPATSLSGPIECAGHFSSYGSQFALDFGATFSAAGGTLNCPAPVFGLPPTN